MKIDIINNPEFQKALWHCVSKTIDACNACGCTYDEQYLENKWQNRLLDAWSSRCNTAEKLIAYAEEKFAF